MITSEKAIELIARYELSVRKRGEEWHVGMGLTLLAHSPLLGEALSTAAEVLCKPKTPGQAAYIAMDAATDKQTTHPGVTWYALSDRDKERWDKVAVAVIDFYERIEEYTKSTPRGKE